MIKTSSSLILNKYIKAIDKTLDCIFKQNSLDDPTFQSLLSDAIVKCFHLYGSSLPKETKALLILDKALSAIILTNDTPSFSLIAFIKTYKLSKKAIRQLLRFLLYGIYFKDIQFNQLQGSHEIEGLLIQILSENISRSKLKVILDSLSLNQQIFLLAFSFKHYREGSYKIIQTLKIISSNKRQHSSSISPSHKTLLDLITGLKQKNFDMQMFLDALQAETDMHALHLDRLLDKLNKHTQKNTRTCFHFFNKLIPLIVDFPVRVYESLKSGIDAESTNHQANTQAKKTALEQKEFLQKRFQHYFDNNYTLGDFEKLLGVIGHYGQMPYLQVAGKEFLTYGLQDKIKLLHSVFKNSYTLARLKPKEVLALISFTLTFIRHLEAITRRPEYLKEGLNQFTCALATSGKLVAQLAALESILEGFQSLISFLNHSLHEKISLRENPIFVYDQSEALIFEKNKKYIHQLNKYYKSSIIHLSSVHVMTLAKKIGIEGLIGTSERELMGYGGSRNCIFLLTPLLKYLFTIGQCSLTEIQKLDSRWLIHLFQQIVLSKDAITNNTILMVDDDMEIPGANIYSHSLFARECQDKYSYSHGFCVGRSTKFLNKFRELQEILKNPSETFDFAQWLEIPFSIKMAEYIGKPKICLNLPLGQEEAHLQIECLLNPILQISHHLGGARYPLGQIPSQFLFGLEKHFNKNIPYVLGISLSMDLIDPSNISNKCILPWNDPAVSQSFTCLKDVFLFISTEKCAKEMQCRFWKNVSAIFSPIEGQALPLRQFIDQLKQLDVNAIIKKFRKTHTFDGSENRSLSKLGHLYEFYQRDAQLFWEFGSELTKQQFFDQKTIVNMKMTIDDIKVKLEKKYHILFIDYPTT
ncbi:MAG: hypothetical protein H0X29_08865, partial [Parachlamydiaceae bacterium]|nr:hypothetical protein [Parachlamydiaceae bacterium]